MIETPSMHNSQRMQGFISQEISRPCKQWIHQVISAKRETERIKLRTDLFVLLPDVECINKGQYIKTSDVQNEEKQGEIVPPLPSHKNCDKTPTPTPTPTSYCATHTRRINQTPPTPISGLHRFNQGLYQGYFHSREYVPIHSQRGHRQVERPPRLECTQPALTPLQQEHTERKWRMKRGAPELHWLAVVTDPALRTLRDLRGEHIPMLTKLQEECCKTIQEETGIPRDQIIAYVHYPPSVYQLHVHFKHPISSHTSYDAFRMHSLASIINNLIIDPEYYAVSNIQLPVYQHTELFAALGLAEREETDQTQPI